MECHNHKPQLFADTKRTHPNNRTNVRKALRLALSFPSEVIAMLKGSLRFEVSRSSEAFAFIFYIISLVSSYARELSEQNVVSFR